jgi:TubC N-terminal docking domain
MSPHDLLALCQERGITLEVVGDRLRCRAPVGVLTSGLKSALADQKAALMQILTAEGADAPYPAVPAEAEVIAIKAWSDILQEAIWVVVDDLSRDEWPADAPVYEYREVKILKEVGPGALSWVHLLKKEALRGGKRTIHGVYHELRPPRPPPALTNRAERNDAVKEGTQKTEGQHLPSGRATTVHEVQHDTQEGTSTTEPATARPRAAQTPSSRTMKVRGQMSLKKQAKLRQQVLARLEESPAIRESRIGRRSGAEVLADRLFKLSWPDCVLLAAYVLGQAEVAPTAWVEAATAAWAEADESRGSTTTLSTAVAPFNAVSAENDSIPAAVASADDTFPNLEDVAL